MPITAHMSDTSSVTVLSSSGADHQTSSAPLPADASCFTAPPPIAGGGASSSGGGQHVEPAVSRAVVAFEGGPDPSAVAAPQTSEVRTPLLITDAPRPIVLGGDLSPSSVSAPMGQSHGASLPLQPVAAEPVPIQAAYGPIRGARESPVSTPFAPQTLRASSIVGGNTFEPASPQRALPGTCATALPGSGPEGVMDGVLHAFAPEASPAVSVAGTAVASFEPLPSPRAAPVSLRPADLPDNSSVPMDQGDAAGHKRTAERHADDSVCSPAPVRQRAGEMSVNLTAELSRELDRRGIGVTPEEAELAAACEKRYANSRSPAASFAPSAPEVVVAPSAAASASPVHGAPSEPAVVSPDVCEYIAQLEQQLKVEVRRNEALQIAEDTVRQEASDLEIALRDAVKQRDEAAVSLERMRADAIAVVRAATAKANQAAQNLLDATAQQVAEIEASHARCAQFEDRARQAIKLLAKSESGHRSLEARLAAAVQRIGSLESTVARLTSELAVAKATAVRSHASPRSSGPRPAERPAPDPPRLPISSRSHDVPRVSYTPGALIAEANGIMSCPAAPPADATSSCKPHGGGSVASRDPAAINDVTFAPGDAFPARAAPAFGELQQHSSSILNPASPGGPCLGSAPPRYQAESVVMQGGSCDAVAPRDTSLPGHMHECALDSVASNPGFVRDRVRELDRVMPRPGAGQDHAREMDSIRPQLGSANGCVASSVPGCAASSAHGCAVLPAPQSLSVEPPAADQPDAFSRRLALLRQHADPSYAFMFDAIAATDRAMPHVASDQKFANFGPKGLHIASSGSKGLYEPSPPVQPFHAASPPTVTHPQSFRHREADVIQLPPLPTSAALLRQWAIDVQNNVQAASGRADCTTIREWLADCRKDVVNPDSHFDEARCPPDLVPLESKLNVAIRDVVKRGNDGNLKMLLSRHDQLRFDKGLPTYGGRRVLWEVHRYFGLSEDGVMQSALNSLWSLTWHGDGYDQLRSFEHAAVFACNGASRAGLKDDAICRKICEVVRQSRVLAPAFSAYAEAHRVSGMDWHEVLAIVTRTVEEERVRRAEAETAQADIARTMGGNPGKPNPTRRQPAGGAPLAPGLLDESLPPPPPESAFRTVLRKYRDVCHSHALWNNCKDKACKRVHKKLSDGEVKVLKAAVMQSRAAAASASTGGDSPTSPGPGPKKFRIGMCNFFTRGEPCARGATCKWRHGDSVEELQRCQALRKPPREIDVGAALSTAAVAPTAITWATWR